ncbi:unnamed protein product [Sphagnum balticum]
MGIRELSYELRLLRCSLTAAVQHSPPLPLDQKPDEPDESRFAEENSGNCCDFTGEEEFNDSIEYLVGQIEAGEYRRALSSKAALSFFRALSRKDKIGNETTSEFYGALTSRINAFVADGGTLEPEDNSGAREILAMAVGVATLFSFLQANLTGPQVDWPAFPAEVVCMGGNASDSDAWARQQLMIDGCDLIGKFAIPQYLLLANHLLVGTKGSHAMNSRSWWTCRTLLTQQRVLAERSSSLRSLLLTSSATMLTQFGSPEAVREHGWTQQLLAGEARVLAAAAQLEAGLIEHAYGHNETARQCFEHAENICGLELSLTGSLGFRTIYQVDAKAQMVLVAKSNNRADDKIDSWTGVPKAGCSEFSEKSEILLAPRLVEDVQGPANSMEMKVADSGPHALSTIEQAIVLAKCLDVKKNSPDDELRSWQMAPFIEAVDAQQQSHPMVVRALCQLLRIRFERLRSRTRERAFLMMENLVEERRKGTENVALRLCYSFCILFPIMPALLKEHAEMMVSCGLVGEAMHIFEELELWDNLIDCYCLLGKKAAASDLINQRLQLCPNDPRLWCSLGDVTLDDELYKKAWEVSGHHFARAQRSLARMAYNQGDYLKSMEHWNLALALNPLHPDGWFALGSASLKARELDSAINAFTRSVQLNPENGESWNNLAALNMHKKKSKEAFVAFREALKFKRNSWQMWENFAEVAMDISSFGQAVLALHKVLDLSQEKRVSIGILTRLVEEVESQKGTLACLASSPDFCNHSSTQNSDTTTLDLPRTQESPDSATGERVLAVPEDVKVPAMEPKETQTLLEPVGKLLARVVRSGEGGGDAWGLQARWHHANGDLIMCKEAALKQVRAYQGSSWQRNEEKFEQFVKASIQLCKAYMDVVQLGSDGKRELSPAQMHLRNTLKLGEQFSGSAGYKALETCLKEVQRRMEDHLTQGTTG